MLEIYRRFLKRGSSKVTGFPEGAKDAVLESQRPLTRDIPAVGRIERDFEKLLTEDQIPADVMADMDAFLGNASEGIGESGRVRSPVTGWEISEEASKTLNRLLEGQRDELALRVTHTTASFLVTLNPDELPRLNPLELLKTNAKSGNGISLNKLLRCKTQDQAQAATDFFVKSVISTLKALWEGKENSSGIEEIVIKQCQAIKGKGVTIGEIAKVLCNRYGLELDDYYKVERIVPEEEKF